MTDLFKMFNNLIKTAKGVFSSRAFATFWIVLVLFVLLSPGMVLDIDGADLTKPQDWPSTAGMKNLLQVFPDLLSGKSPALSPQWQPVLIHGAVAGLLASQLVTMQPAKWGKTIGLGKVM